MCVWKQGDMCFAGQESRDCFDFMYFWRRDLRHLFVSGSWYCQIQKTWLIFFFFFKGAEGQKSFLCIHCCTNISLLQKNPCIFYKTRSLYSNFSFHFWDSPKKQTKVPTLSTISNILWNHYIYIMLSLRPRPWSTAPVQVSGATGKHSILAAYSASTWASALWRSHI